MEIIPTTNPLTNFSDFENRLSQIKSLSPWIQIDVTDGILVSPSTFPLELLNNPHLNLENNLFDIHLMVKEPINWLNKCLFVQATRVIAQVEMMSDRETFVAKAKDKALEIGLAFDIDTPLDLKIPQETNLILLMGRHYGFNPLPLDPKIFDRIKFFKDHHYKVALDGGITLQNFDRLKSTGLDIIYSGQNYLQLINEKKS